MDNPIIYSAFLLFPIVWIVVLNLISKLTGWAELSAYYRTDETFPGKILRFKSVAMRMGVGYNNCVKIGCSPRGLHLSLVFFFRPGHPALFVRWPEISVARNRKWGSNRVELHFQRTAGIPLIVNTHLARQLEELAGTEWPEKDQSRPEFHEQGGRP